MGKKISPIRNQHTYSNRIESNLILYTVPGVSPPPTTIPILDPKRDQNADADQDADQDS